MEQLQRLLPALTGTGHTEKIRLLGWYLHAHVKKPRFMPTEIEKLYEKLSLAPPTSFGGYFQQLISKRVFLKDKLGYRLESVAMQKLQTLHGANETTVKVTALLSSLPEMVPSLEERTYLNEALICYRHGAFRASIVMTWNLAYHHLCTFVLDRHSAAFNERWPISYPGHHKKSTLVITNMDEFSRELKESEVIEICKAAKIITPDIARILTEKLGRRNSAAHPSSVSINQLHVDAFIDDLIRNVVLKLG